MEEDFQNHTADEFYVHLGKLFYAVAAADKVVREEEIKTLKEIVQREWVLIEDDKDEFGTDTSYQIEIIFDWLDENQPKAEEAFLEFKDYLKEHPSRYSMQIKNLIWKTANEIAISFAGKNKAEVIMLAKIKALL